MRHDKMRLIADGRKARQLLASGMKPRDVLLVVGGSRARLYRALAIAESETNITIPNESETK